MSRVLVTGGAGFIGSNTVDLLISHGYDVCVVDNMSTGKKHNLSPKARLHRCDITQPRLLDSLMQKERPQAVLHFAAQIDVRRSVSDPGFDASVNVLGSINLLESCRRHKVKKMVYSSSGGAIYGEPQKTPCDESHPIAPICPYGASKYAVEKYVEMYGKLYGIDYNIMRYGNVYGPRQDPLGEAGVVAIFAGLLQQGKQPVIWGDGEQTRDFVYVGDVALANLAGLEREGKSKVYNIGSGQPTSVNQLTRMLMDFMGAKVEPKHAAAVPGEVRDIYLDSGLARRELGWKPAVNLAAGIKATVDWVRHG